MGFAVLGKRKRQADKHPYLSGNFAPTQDTCPLTPCTYTGDIPSELLGGQYVRNGGNPVSNEDLGREAHWFDGDGMLSGVLFSREEKDEIVPQFVNQYILTDVLLNSRHNKSLQRPILPSISTLVNPLTSLFRLTLVVLRTVFLVFLSWLPGSQYKIKKISVANTSVMYHDGRALATCESGPPIRVQLPSLDTVGWFNGREAEGEPQNNDNHSQVLGGSGLSGWMKEWTTAHPKVDPKTHEMILFHSTFVKPYVHYSIIPATHGQTIPTVEKMVNVPVPGITSAKMMHDFGVSLNHTIIMDLPLSLDPRQLIKNQPIISYDSNKPSRFGVFPRRDPSAVRWFETSACCIFHTVNTWDVTDEQDKVVSVDLMACRLTSASVVFTAGNLANNKPQKLLPKKSQSLHSASYKHGPLLEGNHTEQMSLLENHQKGYATCDHVVVDTNDDNEKDHCRLHYYSFGMDSDTTSNTMHHQFALSDVPFEFPSVSPKYEMVSARYVYGCTTTSGEFNSALGRSIKIDGLVKFDAKTLIARGKANPPGPNRCVDIRTVSQVIADADNSKTDTIQIFQPPPGIYAQEPRFVPKQNAVSEDDGYLLTYVYDESQLGPDGEAPPNSTSELWIIDAKGMKEVMAKIQLPRRVPYGLHGNWFPEHQVVGQRPVETVRIPISNGAQRTTLCASTFQTIRDALIRMTGG